MGLRGQGAIDAAPQVKATLDEALGQIEQSARTPEGRLRMRATLAPIRSQAHEEIDRRVLTQRQTAIDDGLNLRMAGYEQEAGLSADDLAVFDARRADAKAALQQQGVRQGWNDDRYVVEWQRQNGRIVEPAVQRLMAVDPFRAADLYERHRLDLPGEIRDRIEPNLRRATLARGAEDQADNWWAGRIPALADPAGVLLALEDAGEDEMRGAARRRGDLALAGLPSEAFQARLTADLDLSAALRRDVFAGLYGRFGGDPVLAIAAYYAGVEKTEAWIRDNGDPRQMSISPSGFIAAIPDEDVRLKVQSAIAAAGGFRQDLAGPGRETATGLEQAQAMLTGDAQLGEAYAEATVEHATRLEMERQQRDEAAHDELSPILDAPQTTFSGLVTHPAYLRMSQERQTRVVGLYRESMAARSGRVERAAWRLPVDMEEEAAPAPRPSLLADDADTLRSQSASPAEAEQPGLLDAPIDDTAASTRVLPPSSQTASGAAEQIQSQGSGGSIYATDLEFWNANDLGQLGLDAAVASERKRPMRQGDADKMRRLKAIDAKLVAGAIGQSVQLHPQGRPPIDYKIKGPGFVFSSKAEAAKDAIALSFLMTSLTRDPYERGGIIVEVGPNQYTYRSIEVGTYPKTDIVVKHQPIYAGTPYINLVLPTTEKAVAYFHIHPNTPKLPWGPNRTFSEGDRQHYTISASPRRLEAFLGAIDGSFHQLSDRKSHKVLERAGYFAVTNVR